MEQGPRLSMATCKNGSAINGTTRETMGSFVYLLTGHPVANCSGKGSRISIDYSPWCECVLGLLLCRVRTWLSVSG